MVSRGEDKYVIWPIYFDKTATRFQGRKISLKHAVEKPTIDDIAKAAKTLGLKPVIEKDYAHPSRHWKKEGRILIDKKQNKATLLLQIAKKL